MKKINLVIVSPNKKQYSETFIQFHKTNLPANVFFLYGGFLPNESEDNDFSYSSTRFNRLLKKVYGWWFPALLDPQEAKIVTYLKKKRVMAVLAEYGMTGVAMQKVCEKAGIPLFVHFHGYDASEKSILAAYLDRYQLMFSYASSIYVVSKHMRQSLTSMGASTEKLILNHYGPSEIFFNATPKYTSQALIYVGRFVEKKAPHYVIQSFAKAAKCLPNAHLHMVGSGPLLEPCQQLANELNIASKVSFYGVLTPKKILALMNESAALVQHSVTAASGDSEGTPVAILEAGAAALPVVSTRHAGIPDVVQHAITGYLSEEHDVDAMANNMISLLQDPNYAAVMGAAGRKRVREDFSLDQHINRIMFDINSKLTDQNVE